ncbi:hypothetical protein Hanom_Chr03g00248331 [Helianthus anomalus]
MLQDHKAQLSSHSLYLQGYIRITDIGVAWSIFPEQMDRGVG